MRTLWTSYAPIGAIVVVAVSSVFSVGFYTAMKVLREEPSTIVVERLAIHETNSTLKTPTTQEGGAQGVNTQKEQVVASVSSNKFHYLWCPGARQIKEVNRILFESVSEAQAAGFVLAGNCKPR